MLTVGVPPMGVSAEVPGSVDWLTTPSDVVSAFGLGTGGFTALSGATNAFVCPQLVQYS
jgi:hypothetical protein